MSESIDKISSKLHTWLNDDSEITLDVYLFNQIQL